MSGETTIAKGILIASEKQLRYTFGIILFSPLLLGVLFKGNRIANDVLSLLWLSSLVITGFIYVYSTHCEIIVTDKRVFGKTLWRTQVDLPIDSITAIGLSIFRGITVSTASGHISFLLIKNRNKLYEALTYLLRERQEKNNKTTTIKQIIQQSDADELKKYKELLDCGIITQDEFDTKKKQLLGL